MLRDRPHAYKQENPITSCLSSLFYFLFSSIRFTARIHCSLVTCDLRPRRLRFTDLQLGASTDGIFTVAVATESINGRPFISLLRLLSSCPSDLTLSHLKTVPGDLCLYSHSSSYIVYNRRCSMFLLSLTVALVTPSICAGWPNDLRAGLARSTVGLSNRKGCSPWDRHQNRSLTLGTRTEDFIDICRSESQSTQEYDGTACKFLDTCNLSTGQGSSGLRIGSYVTHSCYASALFVLVRSVPVGGWRISGKPSCIRICRGTKMSWENLAVYRPLALAVILAVLREADTLLEHEEAPNSRFRLGYLSSPFRPCKGRVPNSCNFHCT